jgi:DnaJ-class molecular chaperone
MVDAAFEGFAALPAGETSGAAWWDVLGVAPNASLSQAREAYLRLAWMRHPDRGGDPEAWLLVQRAWDMVREEAA